MPLIALLGVDLQQHRHARHSGCPSPCSIGGVICSSIGPIRSDSGRTGGLANNMFIFSTCPWKCLETAYRLFLLPVDHRRCFSGQTICGKKIILCTFWLEFFFCYCKFVWDLLLQALSLTQHIPICRIIYFHEELGVVLQGLNRDGDDAGIRPRCVHSDGELDHR